MHNASKLTPFATCVAVALTVAAIAFPASASAAGTKNSRPSAAAIAAWSATYLAKEKVYLARLAAHELHGTRPSAAAIQAWSDDYRAMWDVYQQQQLAKAQREAASFRISDAVIGGGIVLALAALAAAGFYFIRNRRLGTAPLS